MKKTRKQDNFPWNFRLLDNGGKKQIEKLLGQVKDSETKMTAYLLTHMPWSQILRDISGSELGDSRVRNLISLVPSFLN